MKKIKLLWAVTAAIFLLSPFERLLTFNLFDFTIKPAYVLALILVVWCAIDGFIYCLKQSRKGNFAARCLGGLVSVLKKLSLAEILLLLLVCWSYLSSLWSLAPLRTAIMSSLLLILVSLFMILRRQIDNQRRQKIINLVIWLGTAISIMAIGQCFVEQVWGYKIALLREVYSSRVFGFARPQATFLEPLYLANFLLWPIFFKINQNAKCKNQNFGNYLILIIMLVAFILTLSRGAYLGLAGGLLTAVAIGFIYKKYTVKSWLPVAASCLVAVLLALSIIFTIAGRSGLDSYFRQATRSSDLPPGNQLEEGKNRSNTADIAWSEIARQPLAGIGLNAFGALPQFESLRQNGDWQIVNNEYLEIWVELGIVGLILFLAIIYLAISYQLSAVRNGSYDNIVYLGALTALLVQWLTFSTIYLLYIWVFLAVIWPKNNSKCKDQISK